MEVVGLKVETHPQFTLDQLAMQLSESLQTAYNGQKDISLFGDQIVTESRKIAELEGIIDRVMEWRKSPPVKVSRMDPMVTYDLDALAAQINESKVCQDDWAERKASALVTVDLAERRTAELQTEIAQRHAKK